VAASQEYVKTYSTCRGTGFSRLEPPPLRYSVPRRALPSVPTPSPAVFSSQWCSKCFQHCERARKAIQASSHVPPSPLLHYCPPLPLPAVLSLYAPLRYSPLSDVQTAPSTARAVQVVQASSHVPPSPLLHSRLNPPPCCTLFSPSPAVFSSQWCSKCFQPCERELARWLPADEIKRGSKWGQSFCLPQSPLPLFKRGACVLNTKT